MTNDQFKEIIEKLQTRFEFFREHDPVKIHLKSMIQRLSEFQDDPAKTEKKMRWLGFIQGALWSYGVFSLDELKAMNRKEEECTQDQ